MKKIIYDRLQALKKDQAKGHEVLAQIEEQKLELTYSLNRIEGAIQVLTELLTERKLSAVESAEVFFTENATSKSFEREVAT